MAEHSRYNVSDEESGVQAGVLRNKLGYTSQQDLDDAETILQVDAYKHFFDLISIRQFVYNLDLIFEIHKYFFETLYDWAGQVRTVDISKGEMLFAPVQFLPESLQTLNEVILQNIPEKVDTISAIAAKLSFIHNEFNVVHPFRDGNGRTIRLFLDIIVYSLGFEPIDYGSNEEYFAACVQGALQNHEPLQRIIEVGLKKR